MARAKAAGRNTQISDLRASLRGAAKPEPAPKAPKHRAPRETEDERAEKAERIAQQQHQTSLLSGKSDTGRRYGQYKEKPKRSWFLLQLILVVGFAGGIAMALDPSIVPVDWHQVRHFISQYVKL